MADRIVVMDEGRILQADTPMHLYHHPANLFVAGFIGSPQMNLLDCIVEKVGENWAVKLGDLTLALPKNRFDAAALAEIAGKPMVLGIRPEHVDLDADGFEAAVELAELTGSEVYLHLQHGSLRFMARIPAEQHTDNTCVHIRFPMDQIHLFDKVSGKAIG